MPEENQDMQEAPEMTTEDANDAADVAPQNFGSPVEGDREAAGEETGAALMEDQADEPGEFGEGDQNPDLADDDAPEQASDDDIEDDAAEEEPQPRKRSSRVSRVKRPVKGSTSGDKRFQQGSAEKTEEGGA